METVKELAAAFCVGAVAAGVAAMLLPSGKMEKVMRMLLGFFLVAVTLSPLLAGKSLSFDWEAATQASVSGSDRLQETMADQSQRAVEQAVTAQVQTVLRGLDIIGAEVCLDMDIDEENRISIRQTRVYLPPQQADKTARAREALQSALGMEAEVFA